MSTPLPMTRLLRPLTGPAIWFAHLAVLYGAETLACRSPASAGTVMGWTGAVATLLALGVLSGVAISVSRPQTRDSEFLDFATLALVVLSALGVIWATVPIVMLQACATP